MGSVGNLVADTGRRNWRQIPQPFLANIIFSCHVTTYHHLESKFLVKQEGWVGRRDMEGEVLPQVGLDQMVEHEGGKAIAPPGWVHC